MRRPIEADRPARLGDEFGLSKAERMQWLDSLMSVSLQLR